MPDAQCSTCRVLFWVSAFGLGTGISVSGCGWKPAEPAAGTGVVWGVVQLEPRSGVSGSLMEASTYQDARYRNAKRVDYDRPQGAVVTLNTREAVPGSLAVNLRASTFGLQMDIEQSWGGVGSSLIVSNDTHRPYTLSSASGSGVLLALPPGESRTVVLDRTGPWELFVLEALSARGIVYVCAGPCVGVSRTGRWELRNLAPGPATIVGWHPRLPGATHGVEVQSGKTTRVDLMLGVNNLAGADPVMKRDEP